MKRKEDKIRKSFFVEYGDDADFIGEAFGLQSGFEKVIFEIETPVFRNILYITGESGSGKSVLMGELFRETKVDFDKNTPLFRLISDDTEESLKWLSYVGLGDASLYPLCYNQLSDSQKHRVILLLMFVGNDTIVIDEFLSTLDRKTAKSVSYMLQKIVRKYDKKLIVATAHDDLGDYLMPDVTLFGKSFPSRFESVNNNYKENPFDIIEYYYGDKNDYRNLRLGELHYKGKYTGGTQEYLFAQFEGEIIGVLVSTNRIGNKGRKIARVVVHPSYRGCGVGKAMVKKYISDFPLTEVISVMGKYNPFFEKAGMKRVDNSRVKSPTGLKKTLIEIGFDINSWGNKDYCYRFVNKHENRVALAKFANYANKLIQPAGRKLSRKELEDYILNDTKTAGRVLYEMRDKEYVKYKTTELIQFDDNKLLKAN